MEDERPMKTVKKGTSKARHSMNAEPLVGQKDWIIIKKDDREVYFTRTGIEHHGFTGWRVNHHRTRDQ